VQETRPANVSSGTPVRHPSDRRETVPNLKLLSRLREVLPSCHYSHNTFRLSFATQLLESDYDIPTIHELLGHNNISTNMIYTPYFELGWKGFSKYYGFSLSRDGSGGLIRKPQNANLRTKVWWT